MTLTNKSWFAVGAALGIAAGCNALLDIDHIEFGESTSSSGGAGGVGNVSSGPGATSATSASGGSSSTGGGLGGYPPSPENCSNGTDDNSDGLADCADPLCTCIPEPPNNWNGPAVLYTGTVSSVCPDDWPNEIVHGFTSVSATPVTCDACGCGAANVLCTAQINFWNSAGCPGGAVATAAMTASTCVAIASNLFLSAKAGVPTVATTSSCPTTGGDVLSQSPPVLDDHAVLCGGAGLGTSCAGQDSCVPLPPEPFLGKICVYRNQSINCPNDYPEEHTFFSTVNDSRGCAGCACGAVSGASCTATTTLYAAAACGAGTMWNLPNDGNTCINVTSPQSRLFNFTGSGGSCTVTAQATPVGSVSGSNPVTVCCLP